LGRSDIDPWKALFVLVEMGDDDVNVILGDWRNAVGKPFTNWQALSNTTIAALQLVTVTMVNESDKLYTLF